MGGAGECLTALRVPVEFTGFETHLLWSILINFGFLSFCEIKVLLLLLLLRLSLFFLCGVEGVEKPKEWE